MTLAPLRSIERADEAALKEQLFELIQADPWRIDRLRNLRDVMGEDSWIAAGFIRNLLWDAFQGLPRQPLDDLDVLYFDSDDLTEASEKRWDSALSAAAPSVPWSTKNQARMHLRNKDAPYGGIEEALRHWLETATAVAVRLDQDDQLQLISAFGLRDLFAFTLRPSPAGLAKVDQLMARIDSKGWLRRWPDLLLLDGLEEWRDRR